MQQIIVNEVCKTGKGRVAIRVTQGDTLKTIRMRMKEFRAAFPSGLYEGSRVNIQSDGQENIVSISPIRWFPVTQDLPKISEEEKMGHDYHLDFV